MTRITWITWIRAFKKKEKEKGERKPQLGGLWKVPMLGGPWKVPMFGGLWKEKEKYHFHLFSLSPPTILLDLFFFIDLKVLLYHGSKLLLYAFFSFPWPINYNHASWCTKSSTHSSLNWFWLKIFFFLSLNLWPRAWPFLMGLKLHMWMNNCLRSHP